MRRRDDWDVGGLWCPRCGAEFRLGAATQCNECRVDLTNRAPDEPEVVEAHRDHEFVEYDLSDWGDQKRQAIEMTLNGAGIPFGWTADGTLGVPREHEDDVDTAIDEIEEEVVDISLPKPRLFLGPFG